MQNEKSKFKKNILLAKHTTFKIGGPAKYFFTAKNKDDLIKAVKAAKEFNPVKSRKAGARPVKLPSAGFNRAKQFNRVNLPFFNSRLSIHTLANQGSAERSDSGARQVLILGNGSNVLFSDKGFNGLVVKCQMSNVKCQKEKIYVEAGTKLDDLVKLAAKNSLTGLEWAAGIPGTIGGAVYGNAQAFDLKMSDIIERVEALNIKTLKTKNLTKKQCQFSEKNSIFKKNKNFTPYRPAESGTGAGLIILSAVLKLKKGKKKEVQKKIKENLKIRKQRHPLNYPSAGSVFKNQKPKTKNQKLLKKFPELRKFNREGVIPSAYLIEKAGLKGTKVGKAQVSQKHAGFIINLGGAKSKDVLKLIKLIKQKVKNKFKINLTQEIQIVK